SAYAGLRSGERSLADAATMAVCAFYHACEVVLSPSSASDGALAAMGMAPERVLRWDRGVDTSRFDPALRGSVGAHDSEHGRRPRSGDAINVLYSGRITREK